MDGAFEEQWFSIKEIADMTNISEPTARRYASKFSDFLRTKQYGRVTKYGPETADILLKISRYYNMGMETKEVEERLEKEVPRIYDMEDEEQMNPTETALQLSSPALFFTMMAMQTEQMNKMHEAIEQMGLVLKQMVEKDSREVEELRRIIEEMQNKHYEYIKEMEQAHKKEIEQLKRQFEEQLDELKRKKRFFSFKHWFDKK
ncbi:MAG: hypothetical protein H0Z24_03305 [Thermosipho sp. (in: Bacteria)]|nr:hypothetical protein [Thermosipho sp. (in: thermotogales)]